MSLTPSDPRTTPKAAKNAQPVRHTVIRPYGGIFAAPTKFAPMVSELIYGAQFNVYEETGSWAYGQEIGGGNYVGFCRLFNLAKGGTDFTHRVTALSAPVFSGADVKSPRVATLPLNAFLTVSRREGDYREIGSGQYVHRRHIAKAAATAKDPVKIALAHKGVPYVWGGVTPAGLDCSGLIVTAYRACGIEIARDTDMQARTLGAPVEINQELSGLRRGDLVFWNGHVGIMTNDRTLLHANGYHMKVVTEPLRRAAERIAKTDGPITEIRRVG